ncbi:MAG: helix-turn-helix domain-containing protein, partial [Pseudomonadota bacterium]
AGEAEEKLEDAARALVHDPQALDAAETRLFELRALARKPREPISRAALAEQTSASMERSVDVQVTRLRKKIESDPRAPIYLQTVRGVGYALMAD